MCLNHKKKELSHQKTNEILQARLVEVGTGFDRKDKIGLREMRIECRFDAGSADICRTLWALEMMKHPFE